MSCFQSRSLASHYNFRKLNCPMSKKCAYSFLVFNLVLFSETFVLKMNSVGQAEGVPTVSVEKVQEADKLLTSC